MELRSLDRTGAYLAEIEWNGPQRTWNVSACAVAATPAKAVTLLGRQAAALWPASDLVPADDGRWAAGVRRLIDHPSGGSVDFVIAAPMPTAALPSALLHVMTSDLVLEIRVDADDWQVDLRRALREPPVGLRTRLVREHRRREEGNEPVIGRWRTTAAGRPAVARIWPYCNDEWQAPLRPLPEPLTPGGAAAA